MSIPVRHPGKTVSLNEGRHAEPRSRSDVEVVQSSGISIYWNSPIYRHKPDPTLEIVSQTVLKKYAPLIHGQPVLEAVLDLKRRNSLTTAAVEYVRCDVFQGVFDIVAGAYFRKLIN
jgi:hypothetical protein